MDLEKQLPEPLKHDLSKDLISEGFDGPPLSNPFRADERVKSSTRLQYEAQVRVIRQQIGGLEKVREDLGLSQRKMAQLLLVDPSAWTRWNRPGEEAPPHIWRALQWYLTVREKIPGLTPQYFLGGDSRPLKDDRDRRLQSAEATLNSLTKETQKLRRWIAFWASSTVVAGVLLLTIVLRHL